MALQGDKQRLVKNNSGKYKTSVYKETHPHNFKNGQEWGKDTSTKQGSKESVVKMISFVVLLTIVNIVFFYLYRNREIPVMCTGDSVVNSAVKYLLAAGNVTLGDAIPPECPQPSEEVKVDFMNAVKTLNRDCFAITKERAARVRAKSVPLITLFTTFAAHKHNDTEKNIVHRNTIKNWAKLKPSVYLVLFSNDTEMKHIAKDAGWDLITSINESLDTPPILKDMYNLAMKSFNTPWYGYANGDILFMDDFLNTMNEINETIGANKRVLVTGRRTNVENFTKDFDVTDFASVRQFAQENGALFKTDAEDYFIVSRSFPWNSTPPVVVGRPAYDNWLVGHARCHLKSTVIDATETVMAVHQTTKRGGNIEGHENPSPHYNLDLFKRLNMKTNFVAGLTPCCNYRTYTSFCNVIIADERSHLDKGCECKIK